MSLVKKSLALLPLSPVALVAPACEGASVRAFPIRYSKELQ